MNLFYLILFNIGISLSFVANAESDVLSWSELPRSEMRVLVDRADELLGGTRTDDNKSKSTLRLTTEDQISRTQKSDPHLALKYTIKLGILTQWQNNVRNWFKRKWHKPKHESELIQKIETEKKTDIEKSKLESKPEADPWRFSLEKHAHVSRHPSLSAYARISKDVEGERILSTFFSSAGWSLKNKWAAQASTTSHTRLSLKATASFSNSVQWWISEKHFSTSHGPAVSYLLSPDQAINFGLSMNTAVVDKAWGAESYVISLSYHAETLKNNLFFSATTYLAFAKAEHFLGDPGVSASLEMVF